MSSHVTDWVGAYADGELSGHRLRRVEAHLDQCSACRAELEHLRKLSALLQESFAAESIAPPERFVAQVGLLLPRRPQQPTGKRALEIGWRLLPAGLLGAGAFVQAVFIVAGLVQTGLRLGVGGDVAMQLLPSSGNGPWLGQLFSLSGASLSEVMWVIPQFLSRGGPLGWTVTLNVILLVVIATLFWSWLASWWIRDQRSRLRTHNSMG